MQSIRTLTKRFESLRMEKVRRQEEVELMMRETMEVSEGGSEVAVGSVLEALITNSHSRQPITI
jgi:hypothetical protein